jgi:hypothetical protein
MPMNPAAAERTAPMRNPKAVPQPVGQRPVVAGDAEQAEAHDEQARHRAGAEGDVERRL